MKIIDNNTYLGCAENDYIYFLEDVNKGRVANYLAAMAQSICERYLKHIVETQYEPTSTEENADKMMSLKTHNLQKLFQTIEKHTKLHFTNETKNNLRAINGYYFSTRYPGEDYIDVDASDIEICKKAVELCREEIMQYLDIVPTKEKQYDIDDILQRAKMNQNKEIHQDIYTQEKPHDEPMR